MLTLMDLIRPKEDKPTPDPQKQVTTQPLREIAEPKEIDPLMQFLGYKR